MKPNRISHCIKLSEQEEADFQAVKKATGHGATAIFRAMVNSLKKSIPVRKEEAPIDE